MDEQQPAKAAKVPSWACKLVQLSVALGVASALAVVGRPKAGQLALDALNRLWLFTLAMYLGQALLFGLAIPVRRPNLTLT